MVPSVGERRPSKCHSARCRDRLLFVFHRVLAGENSSNDPSAASATHCRLALHTVEAMIGPNVRSVRRQCFFVGADILPDEATSCYAEHAARDGEYCPPRLLADTSP